MTARPHGEAQGRIWERQEERTEHTFRLRGPAVRGTKGDLADGSQRGETVIKKVTVPCRSHDHWWTVIPMIPETKRMQEVDGPESKTIKRRCLWDLWISGSLDRPSTESPPLLPKYGCTASRHGTGETGTDQAKSILRRERNTEVPEDRSGHHLCLILPALTQNSIPSRRWSLWSPSYNDWENRKTKKHKNERPELLCFPLRCGRKYPALPRINR